MTALDLSGIAFVFLALFGLTSAITRSMVAPAPLWNLMWFLAFITSAAFGQGFIHDAHALILLAAVAAAFNLGCVFASVPRARAEVVKSDTTARVPVKLTLLCLVVSAVGVVSVSTSLGTSILSVRSVSELLSLGQQNAVAIFRGDTSFSNVSKVAFSVMQAGFAIAGAQWRLGQHRGMRVVLVGFLGVAFLWSTITTQRSYLLVPIVWWIGGYIAATTWTGTKVVAPRVLRRGFFLLAVLIILVVWLRTVRTTGTSAGLDGTAFSSSLPWLAGYLPAFSAWYLSGGVILDGQVPGFFGGITGLLGSRSTEQPGGNEYIGAGAVSNAPTMMRDVFALDGALAAALIVVLMGWIAHLAYRRALSGRPGAAAFYAGVVALILWAPNAWFFSYGGRMLTWLLLIAAGLFVGARMRYQDRVQRHTEERESAKTSVRKWQLTGVQRYRI